MIGYGNFFKNHSQHRFSYFRIEQVRFSFFLLCMFWERFEKVDWLLTVFTCIYWYSQWRNVGYVCIFSVPAAAPRSYLRMYVLPLLCLVADIFVPRFVRTMLFVGHWFPMIALWQCRLIFRENRTKWVDISITQLPCVLVNMLSNFTSFCRLIGPHYLHWAWRRRYWGGKTFPNCLEIDSSATIKNVPLELEVGSCDRDLVKISYPPAM